MSDHSNIDLEPSFSAAVSFTIHCERIGVHTLVLSALGSIVLSHHANPAAEYTLRQLSGAPRIPSCLRWWRALEQNHALRERIYTLARQGINPLEVIRVTEHPHGIVWEERPGGKSLTLEGIMWACQHVHGKTKR
jgi:hypothetical protein